MPGTHYHYHREDVDGLLQKTQLDVKLVVKSLQITLEFESGLNRRFTVLRGEPGTAGAVAETPTLFSGTISLCFEPHLKFFIEAEDKTLAEMMEKFRQAVAAPEEDNGVFKASTDLFIFYRQTLVSMAKLSTRKPFLELCKLFAKYLLIFSDTLGAKIPR